MLCSATWRLEQRCRILKIDVQSSPFKQMRIGKPQCERRFKRVCFPETPPKTEYKPIGTGLSLSQKRQPFAD